MMTEQGCEKDLEGSGSGICTEGTEKSMKNVLLTTSGDPLPRFEPTTSRIEVKCITAKLTC